jgi:hypothetical protein
MNPWRESLGCEVNVCQAKHCDAQRMQDCALRKAYQWRVAKLQTMYKLAKSARVRNIISRKLVKLEAKCPNETSGTGA